MIMNNYETFFFKFVDLIMTFLTYSNSKNVKMIFATFQDLFHMSISLTVHRLDLDVRQKDVLAP